jgi:outer membrane protein TolC
MPVFPQQEFPLEDNLEEALHNRPELKQAQLDLSNRDLLVRFAKNQLLPTVDFQGSIGLNGLDSTYGRTLEMVGDTNTYSWEAGVVMEIPLGNRVARGELTQRRLELDQAKDNLSRLELDIVTQVREAARRVRVSSERVEATKVATRLAREQLEAEQEKFRVGLSTSFNVLSFQDQLAQAERNELRALTDYTESILTLEQVKGTLLQVFQIQIPEEETSPYGQPEVPKNK